MYPHHYKKLQNETYILKECIKMDSHGILVYKMQIFVNLFENIKIFSKCLKKLHVYTCTLILHVVNFTIIIIDCKDLLSLNNIPQVYVLQFINETNYIH